MKTTLNSDDLLELGYKEEDFLKQPISANKLYYRKENSDYGITIRFNFYEDEYPNIHIYRIRIGDKFDTFFAGKIKNKAELSKVLEQVTA